MYQLTDKAKSDFYDAYDFANRTNHAAAERWETRVLQAMANLSEWPNSGNIRTDLAAAPLRFWIEGEYVLLYDPSTQPLTIIAILHSARDIADLLTSRVNQYDQR